jgi:hypothetical protein
MRSLIRTTLLLGMVAALAEVILLISPRSLAELGINWPSVTELVEKNVQAWHRQRDLERRTRAILDRMRIKDEVVADLIAGRTTLLRAAAVFRHLHDTADEPAVNFQQLPGTNDAERYCWQVILWVDDDEDSSSGQRSAFVERLKAELRAHIGRPEGVQLPGP